MEGVCGRELLNEKVLSSLYALSIYIVLCSSIAIFLRALFNHKIQTWDTMRWIRFFFLFFHTLRHKQRVIRRQGIPQLDHSLPGCLLALSKGSNNTTHLDFP